MSKTVSTYLKLSLEQKQFNSCSEYSEHLRVPGTVPSRPTNRGEWYSCLVPEELRVRPSTCSSDSNNKGWLSTTCRKCTQGPSGALKEKHLIHGSGGGGGPGENVHIRRKWHLNFKKMIGLSGQRQEKYAQAGRHVEGECKRAQEKWELCSGNR